MVSDKALKRLYNRFNAAYFGGQLPDVTVWWEPTNDAFAITCEIDDPEGGERFLAIRVDPQIAFSWKLTKQQMLHEMAHVAVWCKDRSIKMHSRMYWAEMDRLWNLGAFRKEQAI
jgi:GH43 family beta-xylosidase